MEESNRQMKISVGLFSYKVHDSQRINFVNIALGERKEGDLKLIKNNQS